jgi:hypothetical protein
MGHDYHDVEITPGPGRIVLTLKVVPGASRTKVAGAWGTALKVTVAAPPEAGQANAAVIELLASVFGVRRSDVAIVSGHTQPLKRVAVSGVTAAQAQHRLRQTR